MFTFILFFVCHNSYSGSGSIASIISIEDLKCNIMNCIGFVMYKVQTSNVNFNCVFMT